MTNVRLRKAGELRLANAADVALHQLLAPPLIDLARDLDADRLSALGHQRQIVIVHGVVFDQLLKCAFACIRILRNTDLPERHAKQLHRGVVQHPCQKRIHVEDRARLRVKNQYPVLRGLIELPVSAFRVHGSLFPGAELVRVSLRTIGHFWARRQKGKFTGAAKSGAVLAVSAAR